MITTKKLNILGLSILTFGAAFAQDAEQAKKAIDAEQYQKAKTMLKGLISSNPDDGKNYFLLGDVYLKQKEADSAAIYFNKGKAVKNNAEYNTIGLAHMDLNSGNASAAQAKFDAVAKDIRKKDTEQLIYIGRAYTNADKPNYTKAIETLNKVVQTDSKSAQGFLSLGDAYNGNKQQNEAYKAYFSARSIDKDVLRATMQLGVLKKNTRAAFPEAIKEFDAVIAANPNYGPVYRELAETYYLWGNTDSGRAKKKEYTDKALGYYEKYMSLTDYSLNSRMRHADFLLLTGDYKALEAEAQKMQQMDKVNPVILRYLAYSSYENGNYDASLKAMSEFIAKVEPTRVIARDYLYLGLAKLASSVTTDAAGNTTVSNKAKFDEAIADMKKAAEKDAAITNEFNTIGTKLFGQKLYGPAAAVFEVATANPDNRNLFLDNFYLAYSIYYEHLNLPEAAKKQNMAQLQKGDAALAKVIEGNPNAQDAHLFRAKINQQMQNDAAYKLMATHYDEYIRIVSAKGEAEIQKSKSNLVDAYSNAAAYYAVTNKPKAIEYFNKALALDPSDEYAKNELKRLK